MKTSTELTGQVVPLFLLRRLAASLILLYLVLTATFFVIHIAPGEPTQLLDDRRISSAQRERLRQFYGFDRPLGEQYISWLGGALTGDWGISLSERRSAAEILFEKLPNTGLLVLGTLLVEYGVGISLGIAAAARAGGVFDHQVRVGSLVLYSVPIFWLALVAIEALTVHWPLFPTNQMRSFDAQNLSPGGQLLDLLHHLALPALILGLGRCGGVVRFVRNNLLEVLGQDYIRTARAKGLGRRRVLWGHALRNAVGPLIQGFGINLPLLLSGSVIIEVIFSWPGIGQAVYNAILERDYPLILASTALSGALVIAGSLLADLLQAWVDPRVRRA